MEDPDSHSPLSSSSSDSPEFGDDISQDLVEEGAATLPHIPGAAIVLSERWPSWTFVVGTLRPDSLLTYIEKAPPKLREEFAVTLYGNTRIKDWPQVYAALSSPTPTYVWIQGSDDFVMRMRSICSDLNLPKVTAVLSSGNVLTTSAQSAMVSWSVVSHAQVGGVTDGRWWVKLPPSCPSGGLFRRSVPRYLRHIRRTTEPGSPVDDTVWQGGRRRKGKSIPVLPGLVSEDQRLFHGSSDVNVAVQSVFSTARLVQRSLTHREYMDAYDVDLEAQDAIASLYSNTPSSPSLSFVNETPCKVLFRIAEVVLSASRSVDMAEEWDLDPIEDAEVVPEIRDRAKELFNPMDNPDVVATKSDDAKANIAIWNVRCVVSYKHELGRTRYTPVVCKGVYNPEHHDRLFDALRVMLLRRYRRKLFQGFVLSMKDRYGTSFLADSQSKAALTSARRKRKHWEDDTTSSERLFEIARDLEVGRDALYRGLGATWWEWSLGSTLFFWRWPEEYRTAARDGTTVHVQGKLPIYWKEPRWPSDPNHVKQLRTKLQKVCNRNYIAEGFVQSLTGYFAVPKGDSDIRVVYDGTQSGLNDSLWAPNFFLPTVDSVLRKAGPNSWFGDIDLGEMFLNYPLDQRIQPYAGVDVTRVHLEEDEHVKRKRSKNKRIFRRWTRNLMGCKISPYNSIQGFSWSEEVIRGDRFQPDNPLGWHKVVLNLPGSSSYNTLMPWVYRVTNDTEEMAGFFETYVDDIRSGGNSEDHCFRVSRQVAARTNYLGQQDAPRKRRRPSQSPGAWSGAIIVNKGSEGLYVTCSQEKWDKGRSYVKELHDNVVIQGETLLDRKRLESMRGFLVHLSRTFTSFTPYLKGIHNTLESWRPGRDEDGWKLSNADWVAYLAGQEGFEDVDRRNLKAKRQQFREVHEEKAPAQVAVVRRLSHDLIAMWRLFVSKKPPLRLIRGREIAQAVYGFGDASGSGFGSVWESNEGLRYRLGVWARDKDNDSSNFRELKNLVDTLLSMETRDDLRGKEVFIFTDNSTAERAFHKGSSSSIKLFELVVQLRELETRGECQIHFHHVSGKRMIAQGADGLSRGNLNEGVMKGKRMLDFVPTHLDAIQRSPELFDWLTEQIPEEIEHLSPEGWFERGHDIKGGTVNREGIWIPKFKKSNFLWTPAPAAAATAVEELRKARLKRQASTHLFLCPRLMTPLWEKQLKKACDIVFEIKPKEGSAWPLNMFEPLTLGICFPFLKYRPWQLRRTPAFLGMEEQLFSLREAGDSPEGPFLRKLWSFARELEAMPKGLVWKVLQSQQSDKVPNSGTNKRRRTSLEKNSKRRQISHGKKR